MMRKRILAFLLCFVMVISGGCVTITIKDDASSSVETSSAEDSSREDVPQGWDSSVDSKEDSQETSKEESAYELQPRPENNNPDSEAFAQFLQDEMMASLASDYTTIHQILEDPESYGIDMDQVAINLGTRPDDPDYFTNIRQGNEESKQAFAKFDRETLSASQQDYYDLYAFELEMSCALYDEKFDYYSPVFSSMSGVHYQLATMFGDWELDGALDAYNICVLMEDVLPYVQSCLNYTQMQIDRDLLSIDIEEIVSYCQNIVDKGTNSSVLTSLLEKIDDLDIDASAKSDYEGWLQWAFENSFLPAYQAIIDFMNAIPEGANHEGGYAQLPYGEEYYTLLLQNECGCCKTVTEIRSEVEDALNNSLDNLLTLAYTDEEVYNVVMGESTISTGMSSYEEILEMIEEKMFADFPAIRNLDYDIEEMPSDTASTSGVEAYFILPKLDDDDEQQIRVNPLISDMTTLDVFKTVAHEGFPGHMYQFAYMYENVDNDFTKIFGNVSSYTEGWAVYAGYEAMKYLDSVNENVVAAMAEMEAMSYYAIILLDIGIHYDGWSFETFMEMANLYGFVFDEENGKAQYDQLWANPAIFEGYYYGYLQFKSMREEAEAVLGDDFDTIAFHEAVLKSGTVPMDVLWTNVRDYVARTKG